MKKKVIFSLVVGLSIVLAGSAFAQNYPTKPITIQMMENF